LISNLCKQNKRLDLTQPISTLKEISQFRSQLEINGPLLSDLSGSLEESRARSELIKGLRLILAYKSESARKSVLNEIIERLKNIAKIKRTTALAVEILDPTKMSNLLLEIYKKKNT